MNHPRTRLAGQRLRFMLLGTPAIQYPNNKQGMNGRYAHELSSGEINSHNTSRERSEGNKKRTGKHQPCREKATMRGTRQFFARGKMNFPAKCTKAAHSQGTAHDGEASETSSRDSMPPVPLKGRHLQYYVSRDSHATCRPSGYTSIFPRMTSRGNKHVEATVAQFMYNSTEQFNSNQEESSSRPSQGLPPRFPA